MHPIMIEKLQAVKRYGRKRQFLSSFMPFSLTIILFGLFLSCPLWLPSVCSCFRLFFIFHPKMGVFFVCNIIVVYLVSESKLLRPSACTDMYEEYVRRSKSLHGLSTSRAKEKGSELSKPFVHESKESDEEMYDEGEEGTGEEEERCLNELNKRAEDFIARVNKHRRLEARMDASVG